VRSSVRKLIGMTGLALLVSAGSLAGTAAALQPPPGEGQPASPGGCTFAVSQTTPSPPPVVVSVTSLPTVDEPITVQLFINSIVVQSIVVPAQPPAPTLPLLFTQVNLVTGDTIAVNYILRNQSTYATDCIGPGGQTVIRIAPAAAARLAFTGSSNTMRNVLIAFSAIAIGTVLVVGTRRRNRVNA